MIYITKLLNNAVFNVKLYIELLCHLNPQDIFSYLHSISKHVELQL